MVKRLVLAIAMLALQSAIVIGAPIRPLTTAPYVVVLRAGTDATATVSELERRHGFAATHRYTAAFPGFAARLTPQQRDAVSRERTVASLHDDRRVRLSTTVTAPRA